MKKRSFVLSLLLLLGTIFLAAPLLAQNLDDGWIDEEVAPPPPPSPGYSPPPPPPAPGTQEDWGGRWPWTSRRLIRPGDLAPLSLGELELMRNEIYARHGWVFNRTDLRNHFESQPWYRPRGDMSNREQVNRRVEAELSPIERRNVQIIVSRENPLRR